MALKNELKTLGQPVVLLPTGLYTLENERISDSEGLAQVLSESLAIGTTLKVSSHPGLLGKYGSEHFTALPGSGNRAFRTVPDLSLTIESVKEEVLTWSFDPMRHPYLNYLQAVTMQLYIDGMALGKKLSGGVWMSSAYGGNSANVNQLELMIQLKNDSIYAVSDRLKTYPKEFTMSFSKFELPPYNQGHFQDIVQIEYQILQIRHKNLLQEIAVQSKVMSSTDKALIEQEIQQVETLKQTYPVTIEGGTVS